jgi:transposase
MTLPVLGIDVSKLKFNVCLLREDGRLRHRVFTNNEAGFTQLSEWLKKNHVGQVHACLEATGTYGEALATDLSDSNHLVSLVNPAATKAYAGAQLSRTKTDRVDAELIARFCLTKEAAVVDASRPRSPRVASTCPLTRLAH